MQNPTSPQRKKWHRLLFPEGSGTIPTMRSAASRKARAPELRQPNTPNHEIIDLTIDEKPEPRYTARHGTEVCTHSFRTARTAHMFGQAGRNHSRTIRTVRAPRRSRTAGITPRGLIPYVGLPTLKEFSRKSAVRTPCTLAQRQFMTHCSAIQVGWRAGCSQEE